MNTTKFEGPTMCMELQNKIIGQKIISVEGHSFRLSNGTLITLDDDEISKQSEVFKFTEKVGKPKTSTLLPKEDKKAPDPSKTAKM